MTIAALLAIPALAAVGAYVHRDEAFRTMWLVSAAVLHTALVGALWAQPAGPLLQGWLAVDAPGLVVLTAVSVLFLGVAGYTVGYLRRENPRGGRVFVSCLLAFLAAASVVAMSQHMGLIWVGMEASTLAVAPLIFHRHDRRSLEAVWKYLVLSSVGIALALLGVFFLATAQFPALRGGARPLVLEDLVAAGQRLDPRWLKASFVFLLVGFGTKMGLAPMHTWKPDTYGEAPNLVGALMAGGLTACAFLGVARATQVAVAGGVGEFARPLLIGFGLSSLAVAAAFLLGQTDIKRLLAYSSVEHMGLLALGLGLGGIGTYGALLHVMNNAFAKGFLFLAVGNIVLATQTSSVSELAGVLRRLRWSGALLVVGLFAVTGSPPFGPFVSLFAIVRAAAGGGTGGGGEVHGWILAAAVLLLMISFAGMAGTVLDIAYGTPSGGGQPAREGGWLILAPVALALLVLVLGVYLPEPLRGALGRGARILGGAPP